MPACPKHPKFSIEGGVYFRAGDPNSKNDWIPKNEAVRSKYYKIAISGDYEKLAQLTGEAQLIHSMESSKDSAFVSVAKCPVCLVESTDPTVQNIVQNRRYLCRLQMKNRNDKGFPFVFDMSGEGIGASETEALVLLPDKQSLMDFHDGYYTLSYIASLQ